MLIKLVAIHPCPSPQAVPLANAFLKSIIRETSVEVSLIDFYIGQDPEKGADLLAAAKPRAVGFSMYVWNRGACLEIAAALRRILPETLIFAGGPEATANPEGVLREGVLDFVIAGEGEGPFADLCEHLLAGSELPEIPGLIRKGDPFRTPALPVSNLDTIPSPYLNGILDCGSYDGILWQLSRGCSFKCDFCFDARGNHGVRRFSLERVEAELRHFASKGVSQVFVLDSTFNQDVKRAKNILRLIRKTAPQIHFHFEVRSEFIDREMAELFAQITCSLQIGLQSANPQVLKRVGRSFDRDDFSRRAGLLNDSGAVFGFDLIYGLPGDTLNSFRNSLDYALSLYPNHIDIFPLAILPGTRLAVRGAEQGLSWENRPPYTLLASDSFSSEDMANAAALARACDIFFTRGKAVAWFNAVTKAVNLKPAMFLKAFAEWMDTGKGPNISERDLSDNDIWEMQRIFLRQLFKARNLERFLPVVLDLVDYHHHYAVALLAPQPGRIKAQQSATRILNSTFRLAPSTQLAKFHYEIQDILDCGAPNIGWMHKHLSAIGSHAVIYPNKNLVCTESLDASFYSILENLDGKTATGTVLHKLGLTIADTLDFLVFAQQEGIIEPI
ncbi:MAG: B12-binding domain-containing radical SAM protein [Geobacteraceae bacterium GWC2_55_20]|nr:MAG: B12-binding domain-containing radical SAM protein [Geobacteraceae bacterium GWC2_55_20]OGU26586.1 MAG: B12-binding domain-containing radical SAM protein [Geobacteraceae bacterium GWF2_54_21]HBA71809.1 B12-binding domain-containing radical SAM protein [Geobacter sp.]HCE66188.1 B12-binding domain-containing radical SAM protein [Geobacter sp.]